MSGHRTPRRGQKCRRGCSCRHRCGGRHAHTPSLAPGAALTPGRHPPNVHTCTCLGKGPFPSSLVCKAEPQKQLPRLFTSTKTEAAGQPSSHRVPACRPPAVTAESQESAHRPKTSTPLPAATLGKETGGTPGGALLRVAWAAWQRLLLVTCLPAAPRVAPERLFPGTRGLRDSCHLGPEWASLPQEHVAQLWGLLPLCALQGLVLSPHKPCRPQPQPTAALATSWALWGCCRQEGWKLFGQRVGFS